MRCRRRRASALLPIAALAALVLAAPDARAHEGHDHGAAPALVAPAVPRLTRSAPPVEVVAALDAQGLIVWIDRYDDNAPLSGVQVDAHTTTGERRASEIEPGTYRLARDLLGAGDTATDLELDLRLRGDGWQAPLKGRLPLPAAEADRHAASVVGSPAVVGGALIVVVAAVAGVVAQRRRRA